MSTKIRPAYCRPRPCLHCPFRDEFMGKSDYLRVGRRKEIMVELLSGGSSDFPCHETTVYDEDDAGDGDMIVSKGTQTCSGALLVLLRAERDTQGLRIAERLGAVNTDDLIERNKDIQLWTLRQCLDEGRPHPAEEEVEEIQTCNTVNSDCLAPAGFMVGGEIVRGTDEADNVCSECGEPVCSNCISDDGLCGNCDMGDDY